MSRRSSQTVSIRLQFCSLSDFPCLRAGRPLPSSLTTESHRGAAGSKAAPLKRGASVVGGGGTSPPPKTPVEWAARRLPNPGRPSSLQGWSPYPRERGPTGGDGMLPVGTTAIPPGMAAVPEVRPSSLRGRRSYPGYSGHSLEDGRHFDGDGRRGVKTAREKENPPSFTSPAPYRPPPRGGGTTAPSGCEVVGQRVLCGGGGVGSGSCSVGWGASESWPASSARES